MSTESARPIRVLLVEDHKIVAAGLRMLLEEGQDCDVVGVAGTVSDAVQAARKHTPDVVLMDYRLPDGNGAEATRRIRAIESPPGVVMVTSVTDRLVLGQALDAGCCGFVSKNADRTELINAVRAGANNEPFFTKDMLGHLVHLKRFADADATALSPREIEVLQASAYGLSADQIGRELYLSTHTVKNHMRHAMSKLDAHTKLDAVLKAIRARVISIE